MYKNNKNNKKIIIFIFILINFRFFYANIKKIIIEIDLSGGLIGEGGPAKFVRGLNETLPYNIEIVDLFLQKEYQLIILIYFFPSNVYYEEKENISPYYIYFVK